MSLASGRHPSSRRQSRIVSARGIVSCAAICSSVNLPVSQSRLASRRRSPASPDAFRGFWRRPPAQIQNDGFPKSNTVRPAKRSKIGRLRTA